jgi:2-polyprenyl-6-methoxyphenol hydroxylase-like FAD-dependent oxidoreductase
MARSSLKPDHAIVIGGSIAGLLAANVLAKVFKQVTVIDRDTYPEGPIDRKGVPQSTQVHIILRRGMLLLEEYFPGLNAELARAGAPQVDWMQDFAWFTRAGWGPRSPSNFVTSTPSRGLLEYTLRSRVSANPNISFIQQIEVIELVSDSSGRVSGIKGRPRSKDTGSLATMQLDGDLVVDASGRTSRTPRWLNSLGLDVPEEIIIDADLGYATRTYRIPENFKSDWKILMVRDRPPFGTRGGVIMPIENGQWMVNIAGAGQDNPPVEEMGFLEFARSLVHPEIYESILNAEPVSAIYGYRRTENRLTRYEQIQRWPEGFLVIGDAFCTFNPIYGQGMSVAALEARALERWLMRPESALAFQKKLARLVHIPWMMATTEDLHIINSKENRGGPLDAFVRRYFDEVQWLAGSDKDAFKAFVKVTHMTSGPETLFHPAIILKVLPHLVQRPVSPHPQPVQSLH